MLPAPARAGRVPWGQQLTKMAAAADAGKDKYPSAPSRCLPPLLTALLFVLPNPDVTIATRLPEGPDYGERLGCLPASSSLFMCQGGKNLDGARLSRVILL